LSKILVLIYLKILFLAIQKGGEKVGKLLRRELRAEERKRFEKVD